MDPNQQYNPQNGQPYQQPPVPPAPQPQQPQLQPGDPMFGQPFTPPVPTATPVVMSQNQPLTSLGSDGKPRPIKQPINKLVLGLAIGASIELLLIVILLVVVANKPKTTTNKAATTSQSSSPDAADSTNVQQTDDLISQDISGLNEQQDFSPSIYTNQALGL